MQTSNSAAHFALNILTKLTRQPRQREQDPASDDKMQLWYPIGSKQLETKQKTKRSAGNSVKKRRIETGSPIVAVHTEHLIHLHELFDEN